MSDITTNPFDESAATWDTQPRRVELAKGVGEAVLHHVRPTPDMDVLDYGCGTGLVGLFLLPHVRSVTGADSSAGMLRVVEQKIQDGNLDNMRTMRLDLEREPAPHERFHLIVANMVLHHVEQTDVLLAAFHEMLHPGGIVALADLDAEPGTFHRPETRESVYHHGFDRRTLMDQLGRAGFVDTTDTAAHVVRRPIATGEERDFPMFLIVGRCA